MSAAPKSLELRLKSMLSDGHPEVTLRSGLLITVTPTRGGDSAMYIMMGDRENPLPQNRVDLLPALVAATQEGRAVVVGEADVVRTRYGTYVTNGNAVYLIQGEPTLRVNGRDPFHSHQF